MLLRALGYSLLLLGLAGTGLGDPAPIQFLRRLGSDRMKHGGWVEDVAFSSSGDLVASVGQDRLVRVWDTRSGNQMYALPGSRELASSTAGDLFAVGTPKKSVLVWKGTTGRGKWEFDFEDDEGSCRDLAFSPDGRRLLIARGKTVLVVDTRTGKLDIDLEPHPEEVIAIAASATSEWVATVGGDNVLRLFSLRNGIFLWEFSKPDSSLHSPAFHPDDSMVVVGDQRSRNLLVLDRKSGDLVREIRASSGGMDDRSSLVAFSPSGSSIATTNSEKVRVEIFSTSTGEKIQDLSGHSSPIQGLSFSPDGSTLATGAWDNRAILWDLQSGKPIHSAAGHQEGIEALAIDPGSTKIASGDETGRILLWDLEAGTTLRELVPPIGMMGMVSDLEFSPDGALLASCGWDKTLRIFRMPSGELLWKAEHIESVLRSADFSRDGKQVVVGGGGAWIHEATTGKVVHHLSVPYPNFADATFSPDSSQVFAYDDHDRLYTYDSVSGNPVAKVTLRESESSTGDSSFHRMAFAGDGGLLILAGKDPGTKSSMRPGALWLLDRTTIRPLARLVTGDHKYPRYLAPFRDYPLMASASWNDKRVSIWNLEKKRLAHHLEGNSGDVKAVAVSRDSKTLVSGGDDQTISVWKVQPDAVVARSAGASPPTTVTVAQAPTSMGFTLADVQKVTLRPRHWPARMKDRGRTRARMADLRKRLGETFTLARRSPDLGGGSDRVLVRLSGPSWYFLALELAGSTAWVTTRIPDPIGIRYGDAPPPFPLTRRHALEPERLRSLFKEIREFVAEPDSKYATTYCSHPPGSLYGCFDGIPWGRGLECQEAHYQLLGRLLELGDKEFLGTTRDRLSEWEFKQWDRNERRRLSSEVERPEEPSCEVDRAGPIPEGLALLGPNEHGFSEYRNPKDGTILVLVPGGRATPSQWARYSFEDDFKPPCSPSFLMGRHEVTVEQYQTFLKATGRDAPIERRIVNREPTAEERREGLAAWRLQQRQPRRPVVFVSWEDAASYTRWAGGRLPTQTEWERAGRGDDARIHPWGNEKGPIEELKKRPPFPKDKCDCKDASDFPYWNLWLREIETMPIDTSPYGIHDLGGNVAEWVENPYRGEKLPSDLFALPAGCHPIPVRRSLRGSSSISGGDSTLADFSMMAPHLNADFVGFRLVIPLSSEP